MVGRWDCLILGMGRLQGKGLGVDGAFVGCASWKCRHQPAGPPQMTSLCCNRRPPPSLPLCCLQDNGISDWSGVAAVLCGQKDMAGAITELLTGKGVPKERILTNF